MFQKVGDSDFVRGEHEVLRFWTNADVFSRLRRQIAGKPVWSFLDGPITANNPMGVHHAWGRAYKDAFQRFFAMTGHDVRYQNGFDCQGLWVEVEVEKQLGLGAKSEVERFGIDQFVWECKRRVLKYAAIQTEQSIRLGYWMDWDRPESLQTLSQSIGQSEPVTITTPSGQQVTGPAEELVAKLGCLEWGGSYFTFSTENNETIWTFLKKCHTRGKLYRGFDVMPWSGRGGSAYSQMEVADGRKLTVHRSVFVRFPILSHTPQASPTVPKSAEECRGESPLNEYLLVWTTTPWTLTSNVAAAVNADLEYVQLRTKRDGATYYFAKDNLEFARLAKEYKEGFGRPEWSWPKECPKLKTIAQLFKEQGGFEIVGTVKGIDLVGWQYRGPFDQLPAQQEPGGWSEQVIWEKERGLTGAAAGGSGPGHDVATSTQSAVQCHRVIDGGRDNKGSPLVVAGEGTGIVHIAPGCGDVDHQLGIAAGIVGIAPLGEDGKFLAGFGDFTGLSAVDAATIDRVLAELKERGFLVAVEQYPHIYPHCWRTGDELVFRMVDEWFINMDWRQEIMDVTRQIEWLPESIGGFEREMEWLSNMRDWMISKKRFWGLALPVWVDDQTGDFEVIGSLAELERRAKDGGEGWDEFEGHTPHRPWIDKVKIRNPKTGNLMTRVLDVGNPWLDAGIVSFSTLGFNTQPEYWKKWYPADLVTECFPGQFRNWFYALLSMATMMDGSPPFKTLFGYRLVMNEAGKPMHKSDGTAIWFEEAAEQLGVDTMRWMYLAQNPAQDLRFGTRHKDQPVTLETPDGPRNTTIDGVPTCKVESGPADEIRRQVLIPLWNSYAFFVNYARLDEFDPSLPEVPVSARPEIDRWILSNLQSLVDTARQEFATYNTQTVCREAARFIDDLSNWYIRRNRRRFWRSKKGDVPTSGSATVAANGWEQDKLAAYQTLYEVLLTLTKLLAPIIPFLTERMYRNLVQADENSREASVHLCDYPTVRPEYRDAALSERMALAQVIVTLGHGLREQANQRVRQPLAELRFAAGTAEQRQAIASLADVIQEELNVKRVTGVENLDALVTYAYKPNLKTLGPKYGKALGAISKALQTVDPQIMAPSRRGETVTLMIDGQSYQLAPEDLLVTTQQAADWVAADAPGIQIALSTHLTEELKQEGIARDLVRQVQQARKDLDLEIEDRIRVRIVTEDATVGSAIQAWSDYVRSETLAEELSVSAAGSAEQSGANLKAVTIGESTVQLQVERS